MKKKLIKGKLQKSGASGEWLCECGKYHTCYPYQCPNTKEQSERNKDD